MGLQGQFAKMCRNVNMFNRQLNNSGTFTLPIINLTEGAGDWKGTRFQVGDCIDKIDGRGVNMSTLISASSGTQTYYTSIEQVVFHPEAAQTTLVTSDLRTSFHT